MVFNVDLLFGVIALPAIAPLIALVQLLFPGLLGDHWKSYRLAIGVLTTQSTLMFVQWALVRWAYAEPPSWLSASALAWAIAATALIGGVISLFLGAQNSAPAKIEYMALGALGSASLAWNIFQLVSTGSTLDHMLAITLACGAGLLHLQFRQRWLSRNRLARFRTETVFLAAIALGGSALAVLTSSDAHNRYVIAELVGDSLTYRGDNSRTGAASASEVFAAEPLNRGTFSAPLSVGTISLDGSPVVVDGIAFQSAYRQVSAMSSGAMYCVNVRDDREINETTLHAGDLVWQFNEPSLRPIFSTPAVHKGRLYFGEGYHDHASCRLFCVDAKSGRAEWTFRTTSHVESSPTIVNDRLYFGAGDDGLYALQLPLPGSQPNVLWHRPGLHVDSGPLVINELIVAGGVVGDRVAQLEVIAVESNSGELRWKRSTELPVPSSPSFGDGTVFVGLGNGKMNQEHAQPQGEVWALDCEHGDVLWKFPIASSVLTSPVYFRENVYFVSRNGDVYCVDAAQGQRQWKYEVGETVVAAPIVTAANIIVTSAHGSVFNLDRTTGKLLWRFDDLRQSAESVYSSSYLSDGRLHVAIGGKLHILGEAHAP